MREYWPLPHGPVDRCPIHFTEDELKQHDEEDPTWFDLTAVVNYWRDELGGMSEDGWVRSEMYSTAVERNRALKQKFLNDAEPGEIHKVAQGWPFEDKRGRTGRTGCGA